MAASWGIGRKHFVFVFFLLLTYNIIQGKKTKDEEKPQRVKKDIRDYNDADMERLLDQWEENEEPLENDELPEHLREHPKIDMSKIDTSNPEALLKLSKKGRTLMMFVTVSGNPDKEETDEITKLWQSSLWNNHIQADRFPVDDQRVIFMFKDGALAWDAKDFLIEQERCAEVVIENKSYYGRFTEKGKEQEKEEQKRQDENKPKKHKEKVKKDEF